VVTSLTTAAMAVAGSCFSVQRIFIINGKLENENSVLLNVTILAIQRAAAGAAAPAQVRTCDTAKTVVAVVVMVDDVVRGHHPHVVVGYFIMMYCSGFWI
jgi:hypothetical protein